MCLLLFAIYMTVIMVGRYVEDLSKTSLIYKHYNERQEDKYPTYSICFKGSNLYWQNDFAIFNEYELHPHEFEQMLKGEDTFRYEYNFTSRLYRKVHNNFRSVSSTIFDSFYLKASDFIDEARLTANDGQYSVLYDSFSTPNSSFDPPFCMTHLNPSAFSTMFPETA